MRPIAAALTDWLLLGHIVAAMLWLGGTTMLAVGAVAALRSSRPEAEAHFIRSLRFVGPTVLAPGSLLTLIFGIWLTSELDSFNQFWVQLALGLLAMAFLVGIGFLSRIGIAAERAADRDDHAEASALLRRWSRVMAVVVVLLLVATWDMTFKPGL